MIKIVVLVYISVMLIYQSHAQCWNQVSAGIFHTAAIKSDGTLWACGSNDYGQLGIGSNQSSLVPIQIGTDNNWKHVSMGRRHCIALKNDGTLWTWGANYWGQVGDGTTVQKNLPGQIGPNKVWTKVSAGSDHNIALAADSTIWAWGDNNWAQLALPVGQFGVAFKSEMVKIGIQNDWIDILAGGDSNFGLKVDKTLWGWGHNETGHLGIGPINQNTFYRGSPTKVLNSQPWKKLSTSGGHTAGIDFEGKLWLWGSNTKGQIGDGTTIQINIPTLIENNAEWIDVSCGGRHTLAIRSDNSLWAWGLNQSGQLGDGTTEDKSFISLLDSTKNWIKVSSENLQSFAIDEDGRLYAWGNNESGQLGTNDLLDRKSPTEILCPTSSLYDNSSRVEFEIIPNPSYNGISFSADGNSLIGMDFEIISLSGNIVLSGKIYKNDEIYSISNLASGIYVAFLKSDKHISSKKFIKL